MSSVRFLSAPATETVAVGSSGWSLFISHLNPGCCSEPFPCGPAPAGRLAPSDRRGEPLVVPTPLPLYSPCRRGFLGWSSILGSRGKLGANSLLVSIVLSHHYPLPWSPSATGPLLTLLGCRSSVLWKKLGVPHLGSLASLNLLFLHHSLPPGAHLPHRPSALVSLCRSAAS